MTGLVSASFAGRMPGVTERLDLSAGGLAIAILGIEGGALLGLLLGGLLARRWGSRLGIRAGMAVYAPGLLVAAVAPSLVWLTVGLGLWAAANSLVDVAANAQGVALERRTGRPLLSGLHAAQGIGLLLGALGATAAAAVGLGLLPHLAVVAGLSLLLGLAATLPLLPEAPDEPSSPRPRRGRALRGRLPVIGAVAFCAFLVDGAATNWIAVHLRTEHGAAEALAAVGYLVFISALVAARLLGHRLNSTFSRGQVVGASGLLTAVGAFVAVLAGNATIAVIGWALVGLAVAPLAPTVLSAAPDCAEPGKGPVANEASAPTAIAAVTTVGYLGSFTGPPLIGAFAELVGLAAALSLVGVAGLTAALLASQIADAGPVDDGHAT